MQLTKLQTKFLGKNNIYYETIDSTQSEIFRLIESNSIKNGNLVMAGIQTKGKGTHGRIWHTDETNNIAFSFYAELNCNVKKLDGITTEIANIIVNIFKDEYGVTLYIKEPNDIMFNNKKIGGILTQTKVLNEIAKYIVVGIGINTNKQNFNEDIKNIATSIKNEFNIDVDNENIIVEFCNRFEKKIVEIEMKER